MKIFPRVGLDRGAAEVKVVALHVHDGLEPLVIHRVVELERDDIGLARLAPEVDAGQRDAPVDRRRRGWGRGRGRGRGTGRGREPDLDLTRGRGRDGGWG